MMEKRPLALDLDPGRFIRHRYGLE